MGFGRHARSAGMALGMLAGITSGAALGMAIMDLRPDGPAAPMITADPAARPLGPHAAEVAPEEPGVATPLATSIPRRAPRVVHPPIPIEQRDPYTGQDLSAEIAAVKRERPQLVADRTDPYDPAVEYPFAPAFESPTKLDGDPWAATASADPARPKGEAVAQRVRARLDDNIFGANDHAAPAPAEAHF